MPAARLLATLTAALALGAVHATPLTGNSDAVYAATAKTTEAQPVARRTDDSEPIALAASVGG